MAALRSEATLKSVFEELSRRTGKTVNARNWKKALNLTPTAVPADGPTAVVLRGPDGTLYTDCLFTLEGEGKLVEADVLFRGFETIASVQGGDWRTRFWKKGEAAVRAARKAGWRAVQVRLVPQ
jgi:hypothetical protein